MRDLYPLIHRLAGSLTSQFMNYNLSTIYYTIVQLSISLKMPPSRLTFQKLLLSNDADLPSSCRSSKLLENSFACFENCRSMVEGLTTPEFCKMVQKADQNNMRLFWSI